MTEIKMVSFLIPVPQKIPDQKNLITNGMVPLCASKLIHPSDGLLFVLLFSCLRRDSPWSVSPQTTVYTSPVVSVPTDHYLYFLSVACVLTD
ncbi:hypothetical protein, partial [Rhodonellum psychrophilum]|uniref:hypothetical protein n=1 Tax=Rhodonellum psychrophilum TaxID=336828 RepID=UPI0005671BAF